MTSIRWKLALKAHSTSGTPVLPLQTTPAPGPVPEVLPVADTRVEELRGEAFLTDVWKLTPALTLETGFTFEASRITQTGDAQQEREFTYPKPRAILTWQMDPSNQLRASYIRDVAQLDFAEFASTVAVIDNLTTFGNPNLEPEKPGKPGWNGSVASRPRWRWPSASSVRMTCPIRRIWVPLSFCAGPGSVQDGSCAPADIRTLDGAGNIGNGTRTGIEARFGSPLDFLGIPNAELRFSGKFQKTSVTDPVTGEDREFTLEPAWNYLVSFRQELPDISSAWGADEEGIAALRIQAGRGSLLQPRWRQAGHLFRDRCERADASGFADQRWSNTRRSRAHLLCRIASVRVCRSYRRKEGILRP